MKIAQVVSTFPPYQAGTGNVCFYNSQELVRRGHEVHVFTSQTDGAPDEEIIEGVHVHRLRAFIRFGNAPLLFSLLSINHFDLIHLHYPFIFGAELIALVSRLRQIPYILTYHNDLTGFGLRKILFRVYIALTTRFVFSGASRLICVSTDYAEHSALAALFKQHALPLIEMPNGVDVNLFHPSIDGSKIRQQFQINGSARVILFIGALDRAHYMKGLGQLLEVFASLDDHGSCLLIIGGGELESVYRDRASALGMGDRIVFVGRVQHDQLPEYIAAGDFLVLPSSTESFGMALIEAMACGKPVIATNIPGMRTVVTDGVDGYLVPSGDYIALENAMRRLMKNADQCIKMGQAGRRKVEYQYDWQSLGGLLEKIYREAVG